MGIADVFHVSEHVQSLSRQMEDLTKSVQAHTEAVRAMRTELDDLRQIQGKLSEKIKLDVSDFSVLKQDLLREIADFKIIKSRLEREILDAFEKEIKNELLPKFSKMESGVKRFEDLGADVRMISDRVKLLSDELKKFTDISGAIKKKDFELVETAKLLKSMDDEKLSLMRKIDSLERLVSKMRRRN